MPLTNPSPPTARKNRSPADASTAIESSTSWPAAGSRRPIHFGLSSEGCDEIERRNPSIRSVSVSRIRCDPLNAVGKAFAGTRLQNPEKLFGVTGPSRGSA